MESKERNNERYPAERQERRLIRAAQAGDLGARDELVMAALPYARRNLARLCRDWEPEDIEDLMQEAVPVLYDCIQRYDLSHPARARLYVFASRYLEAAAAANTRHRHLIRYRETPPEEVDDGTLEAEIQNQQIQRIVCSILSMMSIRDQDLLINRHALDSRSTRAAMADRYGCSSHVIEYAEKRALERFKRRLAALKTTPASI